ncbi:MAG: hypothetical protein ABIQ39_13405 [Ilumatobacteraceae bacterium]
MSDEQDREPGEEQSPAAPSRDRSDAAHDHLERIEALLNPAAGLHRLERSLSAVMPAWRRQTRGEHRAAVTAAIAVAIGLMLALPPRVENRPRFLIPGVALLLLVGLVVASPARLEHESKKLRALSLTLIAFMSISNAASGVRLVADLVRAQGIRNPADLLGTGAAIWLTNIVVFSLWYWESDRGGPVQRALGTSDRPDFLFPQMQEPEFAKPDWEPMYVDYLYLAFTNATAFSPTDVMPLSRWAKMVMMVQSLISIVTVGLVIARAVNVLQ